MRSRHLVPALVAAIAGGVLSGAQGLTAQAPGAPPRPAHVRAHRDVVEEVMTASQVDQSEAGTDWGAYLGHVGERLRRSFLLPIVEGAEGVVRGLGFFGQLVIVGAVLLLALALLSRLVERWRRSAPADERVVDVETVAPELAWNASQWRHELEERMRRGEVAASLEAAWWWLARSLAGPRVDESWTSRELVTRLGRRDLAPHLATLDGMCFGTRKPEIHEVQAFVERVETALP